MKTVMLLCSALMLGAALSSFAPMPASAAGPGFCRDYARAAVRQAHVARDFRRCERAVIVNPARWTERWQTHFDWCLGVPPNVANAERAARRIHLEECR
jgi:hypothetical protein